MTGRPVADTAHIMTQRSIEMVSLSELVKSDSPRLSGEDEEHARRLAESDDALPPILVNRRTMRVVDGMHRAHAASLRGQNEIEAVFCDCGEEEAFVLAVKANIAHGLPLPLADRTAAAERIIASYPQWSDRSIASVTGLSHKTIGSIRRRASGEIPHPATRVGRDGRARPANAAEGRIRAGRILSERPDTSLREVAREAGVSPSTVRDVRARLQRGEAPVSPARQSAEAPAPGRATTQETRVRPTPATGGETAPDLSTRILNLRKDPSLRFSESGRALLRLLDACTVRSQEWTRISDNVPLHCVDIIATAARECSRVWRDFAKELEQRSSRPSPS
ncbi:ParB/RepB/Spo0J family partition protein [Streptomyces sp. NPDC054933]